MMDATSLAYKRNTNLHDSISQYAPTLLKSYPIAFRLPLTSHRATHETVKCLPLYLQNSESKKKHRKYPPRGLPQNRFYDTLTVNQMLIRNSFQIFSEHFFLRTPLIGGFWWTKNVTRQCICDALLSNVEVSFSLHLMNPNTRY